MISRPLPKLGGEGEESNLTKFNTIITNATTSIIRFWSISSTFFSTFYIFLSRKEPFTNYVRTLGYLVGQPKVNIINRSYLVKVITRLVCWSKNCKIVLYVICERFLIIILYPMTCPRIRQYRKRFQIILWSIFLVTSKKY